MQIWFPLLYSEQHLPLRESPIFHYTLLKRVEVNPTSNSFKFVGFDFALSIPLRMPWTDCRVYHYAQYDSTGIRLLRVCEAAIPEA